MATRKILYALTLIAYTLSLAHSVIPHHHHSSQEEATAHHLSEGHHHGTGHHHHDAADHHDSNSKDHQSNHSETGHLFFFAHDLNVDVLTRHGSIDNPVKVKKAISIAPLSEQAISSEFKRYLVFHPPQDDPSFHNRPLRQIKLRGPPIHLV
ncbi:MAG TPA: hypothetical protein VGD65_00120 [Chryseosolibacter sp.]